MAPGGRSLSADTLDMVLVCRVPSPRLLFVLWPCAQYGGDVTDGTNGEVTSSDEASASSWEMSAELEPARLSLSEEPALEDGDVGCA